MKKMSFKKKAKIKNRLYVFMLITIIVFFSYKLVNEASRYSLIKDYKECPKQEVKRQTHFESLASKELCTGCEMKIPKVFHRIWTVWDPQKPHMPEIYKEFDKHLKKLHPDWKFVEWDEKKIEEFIKNHYPDFLETYLSYDSPTKKHDASRYLIVNHFGGVFIQHSIEISKNLEPLLAGYEAVFSEQDLANNTICNGFFAAKANHPVLKEIIKKLPETTKLSISPATGPYLVTVLLHDYFKDNDTKDILILKPKYLFPFDWSEKTREPFYSYCIKNTKNCMTLFPEGYGYCLWTGAWLPK